MEKLFLDTFLASQELNVVNNQNVSATVKISEVGSVSFEANSVNKFLDELLSRGINDTGFWFSGENSVANSLD